MTTPEEELTKDWCICLSLRQQYRRYSGCGSRSQVGW